jgi:hypothetical protein
MMSYASAYAARVLELQQQVAAANQAMEDCVKLRGSITLTRIGGKTPHTFYVTTDGGLHIEGYDYSSKEARRLALWILGTFGEE